MAVSTCEVADDCILVIQDKTLNDHTNVIFAPNNDFLIHRYNIAENVSNRHQNSLYEVRRYTSLHNCFTRKLVNECHGIFVAATQLPDDVDESARILNIKKISQRYRSVLLVCLEDLDCAKESSKEEEKILNFQIEMFSEIELVWNLMEVLIFDMHSRSLVLYRLLDWIQWHFPKPEKDAKEILKEDEPCEQSNYWDTVFRFILQGNISLARSLLKAHKSRSREDFLSMDELLRKMPLYRANSAMSWNEFQMRWHHWQDECRKRHLEGDFSAVTQLDAISRILCGDIDTLNEYSQLCDTWYNFLIGFMLYTEPAISISSLGTRARAFVDIHPETQLTDLDNIILSTMELDVMSLIKNCCSYFNDGWWFVAHMTDLLFRGKVINADVISYPHCLRESVLLNYAESLMKHESLWVIGLDYLDQCEEHGREHVEAYLERILPETEMKARKIIHFAKQRHLDTLAKSICKVMTMRAIKNEMFGTALSWVVQSKDVRLATDLANRWINEYSETGKFHCFEILKNLGFCMLVSDKLTFLGKYCEFHKLYQEKEFKDSASLLVSLLTSGLVPKQFQMVLLLDSLPLLEAQIFNQKETLELMRCLEDLHGVEEVDEEKWGLRKKEGIIRLALAKNLANSFIGENSSLKHL